MRRSLYLVAVASLFVGACAAPADRDGGPAGDATAERSDAIWEVDGTLENDEWDSTMTGNISPWKTVSCYTTFGTNYLLTGLQAYKDSGSTDNFIAKLTGECSEYKNVSGGYEHDGRRGTAGIFSGNHQSSGDWTKVGTDEYAAGVMFETDTFRDFVKNIRLLKVSEQSTGLLGSYANPTATPAVGSIGLPPIGPIEELNCPDQYVVTSLSLKYDESNGKIRRVKIGCRHLADN